MHSLITLYCLYINMLYRVYSLQAWKTLLYPFSTRENGKEEGQETHEYRKPFLLMSYHTKITINMYTLSSYKFFSFPKVGIIPDIFYYILLYYFFYSVRICVLHGGVKKETETCTHSLSPRDGPENPKREQATVCEN